MNNLFKSSEKRYIGRLKFRRRISHLSVPIKKSFVLNSGVATDVAAGTDHICYLESSAVTCVGNNSAGQTTVPSLTSPQSVYAGADWSCAGVADGTYSCWGSKAGW